jgi:hypothetical protein
MTKRKPFTRSEMKLLVYNKVKRGMSYDDACKELEKEIESIINNDINFGKRIKGKNIRKSIKIKPLKKNLIN